MRKLLVVVDFQNDFISGALGFPKAATIAEHIIDLIEKFEKNGDVVVFTQDWHDTHYLKSVEGTFLPVPHCIQETKGADFDPLLKTYAERHPVFKKNTFGSTGLFDFLKNNPFESITLVGVVSHICVFTNAVLAKTAQPETPIIVDSKGCASFDTTLEQKGYDILRNLHINVIE